MIKENLLCELLKRISARHGKSTFVTTDELNQWPVNEVALLKEHKLLRKSRPATSVVCTECEEECLRPVHCEPEPRGESRLFLVCEKQSDVNRIEIPTSRLEQWSVSGEFLADLVSELLELRKQNTNQRSTDQWEIGLLKGKRHSAHIVLTVTEAVNLSLAGHTIALADVLSLEGAQITIDKKILVRSVDSPISGGGDIESAAQRRKRLKKTYSRRKRSRQPSIPKNYRRRGGNFPNTTKTTTQ